VPVPRSETPRRLLLDAFHAALVAVDARRCTARALAALPLGPWRVVAAGKAAEGMLRAALEAPGIELVAAVVAAPARAPHDLVRDPRIAWFRAGHPLPDEASLDAGAAVVESVDRAPSTARFLVLLSGGASALLEHPLPGVTLDALRTATARLLASGAAIDAINRERASLSQLKAGGLARRLGRRPSSVLMISDVAGDDPATVGGGPCFIADGAIGHRVVADNAAARVGVAAWADAAGIACHDQGVLAGPATSAGAAIADALHRAPPGLHLWGGECTVRLPAAHGRGGRCQQLALAAAASGLDAGDALLACGTDGRDGPGQTAGALVDAGSVSRIRSGGLDPRAALAGCDAGTALAEAGDLVDTGPTGTNVADLVIAWRGGADPDGLRD